MKIGSKQTSLILKLATIVAAFVFFSSQSPLSSDGALHFSNVLIGIVLIGGSMMFVSQLLLELLLSTTASRYFSVALSAAFVEVLLIASLGSVTLFQAVIIVLFNMLLAWYFVKRFRAR